MKLSLIIPCFNEEEVLPQLFEKLDAVMIGLNCEWEAICINDGSKDSTWPILVGQSRIDTRWRALCLSRNFGHQAAVGAGLRLPPFCRQEARKKRKGTAVPKTKPAYTEEFKREVLAYLASTSNTLDATAKHFGVSANSLREWRENRELQMRCEILKKTVGIFSSPSARATN